MEWLKDPKQTGLRRAFTVWINRVLLPNRMPGASIEETKDLQEVESMLAERVAEWTEQWKQQGLQQGLQQGRAEMLARVLEYKFGVAFSEGRRREVTQAAPETLLRWLEKAIAADTIDEVFG